MTLSKQTSFWKRMFFSYNVNKMRKAMMNYLTQEGLKNTFEDGIIQIEYDQSFYGLSFEIKDEYSECVISYTTYHDDYEALDESVKTFIADKVNTEEENHVIVYAFNDSIKVVTRFYFSNERMMLDLFARHFHELVTTADDTIGLIISKIEDNKANSSKPLGFVGRSNINENEEIKIVAEKKQEVK